MQGARRESEFQSPKNNHPYIYLYKSPRSFLQRLWGLWRLCAFSAPAAPAKTPLFTAREPLWHSKWPLGPARVLLERSEGLFWACFDAASALKMAILACSGATRALKKPVRARLSALSALKEAVRACCSRSLFKSAGLGYTLT